MTNSTGYQFQQDFFAIAPRAQEFLELFEYLPAVDLYVKDRRSRFVKVNATHLATRGITDEEEMLGKTDRDYHPPALAEAYMAEDRRVMEGRRAIPNQVWLVPHFLGTPQWYVSSKTPLFSNDDKVVGIAGVMYRIETPEDQQTYFQELRSAILHIGEHYTEKIRMTEMASLAEMSTTHFNRRFRTLLHLSPSEYVLSLRVQHAQRLLTEGSENMAQISAGCGFSDQSHFTKRFLRATGMTPSAYRNRFRQK